MAAMRERAKRMRRRDVFAGEAGDRRGEEGAATMADGRAEIVIDEHMLYLLGRSCDQAGSAVCARGGRALALFLPLRSPLLLSAFSLWSTSLCVHVPWRKTTSMAWLRMAISLLVSDICSFWLNS